MADEFVEDTKEVSKSVAIQNRENFEKNIKNIWGYSETGLEAKKAVMTMLATKTGMFARIPLICKGDNCPYAESCPILPYNLAAVGEPCAIETTQIELRSVEYTDDFDLDKEDASFTDKNIVNEIINLDIMIERCKALIAKEGVPVIDVIAGVAENGEEYTQPQVSKFLEAYERLTKKRNEMYDLMMATRKNKKDKKTDENELRKLLDSIGTQKFIIEERPENLE